MSDFFEKTPAAKYDLIVFDFDGTLANSFDWFVDAIGLAADRYGFSRVGTDERDRLSLWTFSEITKHLGVPFWKVPMVAHFMREQMQADIQRIQTFPGIDNLLPALSKAGIALALVTSNSQENVQSVLGSSLSLFVYRSCGVSVFGKASKLKKILSASGVAAERSLLIGDELRDEAAARAVGMHFGAVSWGYNHPEVLCKKNPDAVFQTVQDICDLLVSPHPIGCD